MIDTHCHLDDVRLAPDRDAVIARARAAGVRAFVTAGVDPGGWRAQDELARCTPGVAVTYGLHPRVAAEMSEDSLAALLFGLDMTLDSPSMTPPVAVGEIGLDGWTAALREAMDRQEHALREQLALARDRDLPVVLHILRAHGRALDVLRSDGLPRAGGMVHCYSGAPDLVRDYVALGLHISFAGPITWPDAHKLHEAARAVPSDRLLVETDSPDLAPETVRPGRNEPSTLPLVVAAVAAARGEDPEHVAALTMRNAQTLFPRLTELLT